MAEGLLQCMRNCKKLVMLEELIIMFSITFSKIIVGQIFGTPPPPRKMSNGLSLLQVTEVISYFRVYFKHYKPMNAILVHFVVFQNSFGFYTEFFNR